MCASINLFIHICVHILGHTHTRGHTHKNMLAGRWELEQGQLAHPESSSWVPQQITSWQLKWSPVCSLQCMSMLEFVKTTASRQLFCMKYVHICHILSLPKLIEQQYITTLEIHWPPANTPAPQTLAWRKWKDPLPSLQLIHPNLSYEERERVICRQKWKGD